MSSLLIMIFGPLVAMKITSFDVSENLPDIIQPLLMSEAEPQGKTKTGMAGYKLLVAEQKARRRG
ncbi:hypothetical protein ACO0OL_000495 [Hanseniaspora opuntiae]